MILNNSKQAMDIVLDTIDAKEQIALESLSIMSALRAKDSSVSVMQIPKVFREFSVKIDDVYSTLQNITVDESETISLLKIASRSPKNMYDDASIIFVNPDNVGRINADYIHDFAKDIASTADGIIHGDITSTMQTNVSAPVVEGIKRQLVAGSYKGNTSKNCFGELPKGIPYEYDSMFINSIAVPFVKSFASKKVEVSSEITDLSRSAEAAFAVLTTASESKEVLTATTEARQVLTIYLAAAATALVDIVSFASYLLIRKMDIMIANATAINEMCDNIRSNSRAALTVSESVEDRERPVYNITTVDQLVGMIRGICSKIKYNIMNRNEGSSRIGEDIILGMVDQYRLLTYPAEIFIGILDKKKEALSAFAKSVCTDEYPVPTKIAMQLGLYENMASHYSDKFTQMTDLSTYTEMHGVGATDKAFAAIAELNAMVSIVKAIASRGTEIVALLEEVKMIKETPTGMISSSMAVRNELEEVVGTIASNISGDFIPAIFDSIDHRCVLIDSYIDNALFQTTVIVPSMREIEESVDYVELAMQSDIDHREFLANINMKEAVSAFNNAKTKKIRFLATEAEMPAVNKGGATPGNPTLTDAPASGAGSGSGDKPGPNAVEVEEDPSKKSETDTAQDNAAADAAGKDPASIKEKLKNILNVITGFFDKIINDFASLVKSKKYADGATFITANKEAILARNFNGVTLKIPHYPELSTTEVVKEINQVATAISALNAQSINSSDEMKLASLLFPFADLKDAKDGEGVIASIKKRYIGEDKPGKDEYSGAKLRNKAQSMISFCENYYVDKKSNDVSIALGGLKTAVKSLLTALSSGNDMSTLPDDGKIQFINRATKMFAGAITTTYRNQSNSYMSALKSLVPKKKAAPAAEGNEQQAVPDTNTPAEPAAATDTQVPTV